MGDGVVSLWYFKGLILFSLDRLKQSSTIFWELYIQCRRPLPFGETVFFYTLAHFITNSQAHYE